MGTIIHMAGTAGWHLAAFALRSALVRQRWRFERNRARRIPRNKRRLKMPNWCHNYMEITGSSDEIARFKRTCVVFAAEQAHLDFDAIVPMPGIFYDDPGETPDPDALKNRER